jgi:hypothetical protein
MKKLFVVKDGLKNQGCKVNSNGEQIRNTNFYLLTYGKNNEGYIEKKAQDNWRLYTQIGELNTIREMHKEGIVDKSQVRYHHFPTFDECIEKLKELCGSSVIEICDSDSYPTRHSSE